MIETLIVPGLNGSPEGHWQHRWMREDAGAELVEQEDWTRPDLPSWLHALEARIEASRPGVLLVAHSLGCALVAALAGRPASAHVGGALLVAPADLDRLAARQPTVDAFRVASERRLPFASILVASRSDPFMSFERAERQAETWGSALVDLGDVGHVNIASGHGVWPEGAALAAGLRGRTTDARFAARTAFPHSRFPHPASATAHDAGLGLN